MWRFAQGTKLQSHARIAMQLTRQKVAKFRIAASAEAMNKFDGASARGQVRGINDFSKQNSSVLAPAKNSPTVLVSFNNQCQTLNRFCWHRSRKLRQPFYYHVIRFNRSSNAQNFKGLVDAPEGKSCGVTSQQSTIVLMAGRRLRKLQFRESPLTHRHGERLVPRHESWNRRPAVVSGQ